MLAALEVQELPLAVVEANLEGRLLRRLAGKSHIFAGGEIISPPPKPKTLNQAVKTVCQSHNAVICLGVLLESGATQQTMHLVLLTPEGEKTIQHTYGGPPQMAPLWTVNLCLDHLRKLHI